MKPLVHLLLILFAFSAAPQHNPVGELAGRSVEMTLVKADDLSEVAWPEGKVELKQVRSTISADENILFLLQANGIAPDSEALTVVYDLNPSIRDIKALFPGASLQLPSVAGSQELHKLLLNGYIVELTADPEIRNQMNARIDALKALAPSIDNITSDVTTRLQLRRTLDWFQEIEKRFKRRTGPPQRRSTLLQIRDEAGQLYSLVQGATDQHRQLTASDKRQTAAIFEDIQTEIKQYGQVLAGVASGPQQFYAVTVTIKGTNRALIDGLRVYYTFNGLFRPLPAEPPIKSFGFTQLGSGTSESLLMKNYQIWAARDGDPNHPLTPTYLLHIDETSPSSLLVDLSLKTEPPQ